MALARVVQGRTSKSAARCGSVRVCRLRECGAFLACDTRPPCSSDPRSRSLRSRTSGVRALLPIPRRASAPSRASKAQSASWARFRNGPRVRLPRDVLPRGATERCQTPRYLGHLVTSCGGARAEVSVRRCQTPRHGPRSVAAGRPASGSSRAVLCGAPGRGVVQGGARHLVTRPRRARPRGVRHLVMETRHGLGLGPQAHPHRPGPAAGQSCRRKRSPR